MFKNRTKGFYILALALAILVLPGCEKKTDNQAIGGNQNQEQNQGGNQNEDSVNPTGEYTINELLAMNKPLKCTWKKSLDGDSEVTNLIYFNGKKFYQDVIMGDIGHSYVISDGEYLYVWNDFTEVASKMNIKEMEKNAEPVQGGTQGGADLEQKLNFACEKWSADNSMFVPPADKNFKDVTEEMGQAMGDLQENADSYKQQLCDMCAQSPTQELRDACLQGTECD